MYELHKNEYDIVRPIFANIGDNRAHIFAAIEGNSISRIFLDNAERPTAALISMGWCFLGGNEKSSEFNRELKELFVTDIMPKLDDRHFMAYSYSDEWKNVLDEMLKDLNVRRINRTVLDLDPDLFRERYTGWRERIPEGYHIRQVDKKLAEALPDVGNYMGKGFGFCVMKGDKIISTCSTVHTGGGRTETSIKTDEEYRRQGFASLAVCAYVEHCFKNDLLPEWGCFYNEASGLLAEKLCFVNRRDVQVNYVHVAK